MDNMLNRTVRCLGAETTCAVRSELSSVDGPWSASCQQPARTEAKADCAAMDAPVTVQWRIGLSSRPPRTLRMRTTNSVGDILTAVLEESPALRARGELKVTDLQQRRLDGGLNIGSIVHGDRLSLSVCILEDGLSGQANVTAAGRSQSRQPSCSSSSSLTDSGTSPQSTIGSHLHTVLYRVGRTSSRPPRPIPAGPLATVLDIVEEIAEREPVVARKLDRDGPQGVSVETEEGRTWPLDSTVAKLRLAPGGTTRIYVV